MGNMKILAKAKNLWMKFNVRGVILTSLSLQVFLTFLAPIRKGCSNRWFMMLIWSAYIGADLVANYAFGLISRAQVTGGASDTKADAYGDLLAFWALFLLLHLGGLDTITAFALEDNELWRRHLLNLLFQLGAAGYVFYQSFPSSKLVVPTILMFIGGTIKYIERTIALHLASFSKLRGSLLPPADAGPDHANLAAEKYVSTKRLAMVPESKLPSTYVRYGDNLDDRTVIKEAFFYFTTFKGLLVDLIFSFRECNNGSQFFGSRTAKDAFRVIEAELNFFYDVLYTKAAIVHCPTGYIFRAISIGSIVSAFASFCVLNKHGFHEYDMQITYTLLLGAIGLEFVALDSRLRKWPKWIEKLLGFVSLEELFDDLKSGRVEQYRKEFGELIFYELKRKASLGSTNEICASRGKWALESKKKERNCEKLLPFVCDVDYGKSLLLWHIATELCYNTDNDESTKELRETSKVLSDYVLHLMIKQPSMMSAVAGIGQIRFRDTCAEADRFFDENIFDKSKMSQTNACRILLSVPTELNPALVKGDRSQSALFDACILANELRKFQDKKWDIVSEVWVELLAYAAIHCQPFLHAQQLSKGGELVTLVWLLMVQLGLSEHFQIKDGHVTAWVH